MPALKAGKPRAPESARGQERTLGVMRLARALCQNDLLPLRGPRLPIQNHKRYLKTHTETMKRNEETKKAFMQA